MTKKYNAYLTTDILFFNEEVNGFDWASDTNGQKVEVKKLGKFKTFEEAKEAIYASGQLQDYYSSCFIDTEEDGELYSSVPALTKCKCCGKEEWERLETNDIESSVAVI